MPARRRHPDRLRHSRGARCVRQAGALGRVATQHRVEEQAMADPVVLYEVDDKVSVITLNRPDKLNAISPELMRQLLDAFARADDEPATSVVLLRAEGRSFCAGYD